MLHIQCIDNELGGLVSDLPRDPPGDLGTGAAGLRHRGRGGLVATWTEGL